MNRVMIVPKEKEMIIVGKFRGKTRERFPEWVTSIGIFWWGVVAFLLPGLFESQIYFYPLSVIMAQPFWAIAAIFTGIVGFISLMINGIWRPTAHMRAISSILKITLWTTLMLAAASTDGRQLGVPTFGMLMSLDIMALWWAAGDARLADDLAKKQKQVIDGN